MTIDAEPNAVVLTPEQEHACEAIVAWFTHQDRPTFTLGGLAGTGKTTLMIAVTERLNARIAYCAYTGKAAHVLRSKLEDAGIPSPDVSTIHGLMYWPVEKEISTGRFDSAGHPITKTTTAWKRREVLPAGIQLVIVDEASMIDQRMWDDLSSYGVPILALGDHFQLPPIGRDNFSLMTDLDYKLETIHRQAAESPIIQVARWARERLFVPFGYWSPEVRKIPTSEASGVLHVDFADTYILAGYNRTRVSLNRTVRSGRGYQPDAPVVGDRVVCRRNNHPAGIFNGMTGTIVSVESESGGTIPLEVQTDYGLLYRGRAVARYFHAEKYAREIPTDREGDVWDYGYALTVHCAQGSQAHNVVVIEEQLPGSKLNHARWLYTAVTRATDDLLIMT